VTRSILPVFLALLGLLPVRGDQPLAPAETAAVLARIQARRWQLGLDPQNDFQVLGACRDALGQTHVRFQQLFQGVRVYGGEAIDHADAQGAVLDLTDALYRGIQLPVQPSLTPAEALARAEAALAPAGPYAHPPVVELVIWPVRPLRPGLPPFLLAYHVHAQLENGARETRHRDYFIEANTGAILKQWDSLRTEAATGPGLTQYSGTVTLDQDRTAQGYRLLDRTRGRAGAFGGNGITDLAHGTSGNGTLDSNPEPSWGDHANYTGSDLPTTGPTGQTAMADAAYGTQVTWDMYRHVFGRDGIDGKGTATFGRTHYDTSFDNAFWDDTCFCMTYGDGSAFTSVEALDVAGHEMTHGVCSSSANLDYTGESGGLNEANSDIFGTMAEFYSRGGGYARAARTIPERGGNWTIGEQLASAPLRWMDKPSKDGQSPDAWSDGLGDLDVHLASGPMNRCFYFMSQGASAADGDHHSDDLPSGMAGVGNQRAAQIWYRALTVYLTSQSDYAAARKAALRAATDLYGAAGEETQAVARAFQAIHVGPDPAGQLPGQRGLDPAHHLRPGRGQPGGALGGDGLASARARMAARWRCNAFMS